ncbi:MAG TPA: DUF2336 domain-containing protein [Rhizomicrobium sp.]|nr:DUF2336 domain-containing protein [Rhizomicrobium sp.]
MTRLVELAAGHAPEERRRLTTELCDLLLDWPDSYPDAMREPFETLLEKTVRLIDGASRTALIARIAEAPDARLDFLNEFFFDAPQALRHAILDRNGREGAGVSSSARIDEAALIETARREQHEGFAERFAAALGVRPDTAARILHDASAEALAIAAKGAGLSRATFSTLALIAGGVHTAEEIAARLAVFETVSPTAAQALLTFWRTGMAVESRAA